MIFDTAFMSIGTVTDISNCRLLSPTNHNRNFFCVSNGQQRGGVWIKFQESETDNVRQGIYVPERSSWCLPQHNIYTGPISVIADKGDPMVHYTEY